MALADDRHFPYQNEDDLVDFIASEMQKEGLDFSTSSKGKGEQAGRIHSTLRHTGMHAWNCMYMGIFGLASLG